MSSYFLNVYTNNLKTKAKKTENANRNSLKTCAGKQYNGTLILLEYFIKLFERSKLCCTHIELFHFVAFRFQVAEIKFYCRHTAQFAMCFS